MEMPSNLYIALETLNLPFKSFPYEGCDSFGKRTEEWSCYTNYVSSHSDYHQIISYSNVPSSTWENEVTLNYNGKLDGIIKTGDGVSNLGHCHVCYVRKYILFIFWLNKYHLFMPVFSLPPTQSIVDDETQRITEIIKKSSTRWKRTNLINEKEWARELSLFSLQCTCNFHLKHKLPMQLGCMTNGPVSIRSSWRNS